MAQLGAKNKFPPAIILVRPQLPENIGAVARVMANFGLKNLRLVNPLVPPLDAKAIAMAARASAILESAPIYPSLDEALADLLYVYGTSAGTREMIKRNTPIREAMEEIAICDRVGIIFGPERTGLTNEELSKCRAILYIPVDPKFSSLNLAQAVAITAYEWHHTQLHASIRGCHGASSGFFVFLFPCAHLFLLGPHFGERYGDRHIQLHR